MADEPRSQSGFRIKSRNLISSDDLHSCENSVSHCRSYVVCDSRECASDPSTDPRIAQIGDYYADRQKWDKAFTFYTKGKNIPALVQCAYALEDYASLEQFMHQARVGQLQSTMAPPFT